MVGRCSIVCCSNLLEILLVATQASDLKALQNDHSRGSRYYRLWWRIMWASSRAGYGITKTQSNDYSCVVAGRLANLDHNLQVMLIEAGESNLNVSHIGTTIEVSS